MKVSFFEWDLFAKPMTTEETLVARDELDKAGSPVVEAWGGATLDTAIRFLNQDPWERLRKSMPNAPTLNTIAFFRQSPPQK